MFPKPYLAIFLSFLVMQAGNIRYFQIASSDRQGTGTKIQMASGSPTPNNFVKFDSSGNVTDSGIPASGGGGGGSSTPTGLIAFFESQSCPDGWSEYTTLRGRYVVGTWNTTPRWVGQTVGVPLSVNENRLVLPTHVHYFTEPDPGHTHNYSQLNYGVAYFGVTWGSTIVDYTLVSGANSYATTPTKIAGNTQAAGFGESNGVAPYVTLLPCRKN